MAILSHDGLFSRMEHPIKSIAGIGSITGPLIAAELGDLRRFEGRRPVHAILATDQADWQQTILAADCTPLYCLFWKQ